VVPSEQSGVKRNRLEHTKQESIGRMRDPLGTVTEHKLSTQEIKGADPSTAEP